MTCCAAQVDVDVDAAMPTYVPLRVDAISAPADSLNSLASPRRQSVALTWIVWTTSIFMTALHVTSTR